MGIYLNTGGGIDGDELVSSGIVLQQPCFVICVK